MKLTYSLEQGNANSLTWNNDESRLTDFFESKAGKSVLAIGDPFLASPTYPMYSRGRL